MSKSLLAACLMATALTAAPAFAQAPAAGQFMKEQAADQWRGSKLMGLDVYGTDNQKIGDIRDVLLDRNGEAKAVVIGVGGFLGIGEKDVAVPFKTLQFSDEPMKSSTSTSSSSSGNTSSSAGSSASGSASSTAGTTGTGGTSTTSSANRDSTAHKGYPDHAKVTMTKNDLQNAPDFHYAGSTSRDSGSNRPAGTAPGTGMGTGPATGTGTGPATGAGTGTAPRQ
jgi:sporulation protein YlmC with PRC-barrel domain